jgi:hypothetical protein
MTDDDDLGIDLGFRTTAINSVEQRNLSLASRGKVPMPRPILSILNEFAEEKINRAARDGDSVKAMKALCELRHVLSDLVTVGHPEFKATIQKINAGMARLLRTGRTRLLQVYLDAKTSDEEARSIGATLVLIAESGAWPEFQYEFPRAVEAARLRNRAS